MCIPDGTAAVGFSVVLLRGEPGSRWNDSGLKRGCTVAFARLPGLCCLRLPRSPSEVADALGAY